MRIPNVDPETIVYFKYDRVYVYNGRDGLDFTEKRPQTKLKSKQVRRTIAVVDVNHALFMGSSLCSSSDNFDKKRGRKIALARALQAALPGWENKSKRRAVWDGLVEKGMKLT